MRHRTMLYGYIPEEQFLLDVAKELNFGDFSDAPEDNWSRAEAMKDALKHVIRQAKLGVSGRFGYVKYEHRDRMIIALATTKEHVRWPRPTVGGVKRLQEILGVMERPQWYKECD